VLGAGSAVLSFAASAHAQSTTPASPATTPGGEPKKAVVSVPANSPTGKFIFSGSLRSRIEHWNFFDAPGFDDSYTFNGTLLRFGALRQTNSNDIQLELAAPLLIGLPKNTIAPPPLGPLGLGANYRAANGGQDASIFPKQAFIRLKGLGSAANSLRFGRFEFWDGSEVAPKNPILAAVKRDRIAHRLLGNFGFSHVGRSFDGAQFVHNTPSGNFTVLAARPTEGVFQLNGFGEVRDVDFAYAAYTKPMQDSEARIFGLTYRDGRDDVVKTSNNATPIRGDLRINTLGAHFLKAIDTGGGSVDLLAWGALQNGDYGNLSHRANAVALEVGYQPKKAKLRPWLRAGLYRASGDDNPADGKHGTFFSALPTPRIYARMPFYNQMNIEDAFVQGILRPSPKLTARADFHFLKLNSARDLQYSGGGAFQDNSFGYAGRGNPSGKKSLANVLDLSLDYAINPETSVTLYGARAFGKDVLKGIFPTGSNATYLYAEVTRKF
jgi:hypothetical protein